MDPTVFGLKFLDLDYFWINFFFNIFEVIQCNMQSIVVIVRGYKERNAEYCGNGEINMEVILCYLPIQYAVCWVAKHTLISDNGMQYAVLL